MILVCSILARGSIMTQAPLARTGHEKRLLAEALERWTKVERALAIGGPASEEELIIKRKLDRLTVKIGLRYGIQHMKEVGLTVSFSAIRGGVVTYRLREKESEIEEEDRGI